MYPALKTLLENKIPVGVFGDEEYVIAQPKCDGIWFKLNFKEMTGRTKDCKKYDVLDIFQNQKVLPWHNGTITHTIGELVYVNKQGLVTRDRHKVMDVLLRHKNWEEYLPNIRYVVFDVVFSREALLDAREEKILLSYQEVMVKYIGTNKGLLEHPTIIKMPTFLAKFNELNHIKESVRQYHEGKLEGLVVRKTTALHHNFYKNPPAMFTDCYKLKPVHDASLRCVGFKPHSKNPAWIGALFCETKEGELRIPIGIGLTKPQRQAPVEDYLGKTIEIEFEDLHVDEKALVSARIKYIREDTEPDTFSKLVERVM